MLNIEHTAPIFTSHVDAYVILKNQTSVNIEFVTHTSWHMTHHNHHLLDYAVGFRAKATVAALVWFGLAPGRRSPVVLFRSYQNSKNCSTHDTRILLWNDGMIVILFLDRLVSLSVPIRSDSTRPQSSSSSFIIHHCCWVRETCIPFECMPWYY